MQRSFYRFLTISVFVLSLSVAISTSAQPYGLGKAWRIGAGLGATKFYGDLTDNTNSFINNTPFSKFFYQDRKLGYNFILEKSFNPYFGIRGMFFGGKIKSTQESTKQYFEANYFDYSLSLTMDFTSMIFGPDDGRSVRFFGFAGIGLSESRTWKYDMITGNIIATNGFGEPKNEGGPRRPMTEMVYPIGLGVSLFANEDFNVNIEGHLHMVTTNKLDATPIEGTKIEMVGYISVGVVYNFSMNGFGRRGGGSQSFEGRSNDPSLREFNKRKRVVMRTKYNKNSFKKRRRFKHQRR
jgi:hypothetical protein